MPRPAEALPPTGVRPGDARARLLAAAVRVYARSGWRGATTRVLAAEAGVNEATLYRQFGSKQALLVEAVRGCLAGIAVPLPLATTAPYRDLTVWCAAQMAAVGRVRGVLRRCTLDGVEGDPALAAVGHAALVAIATELRLYVKRLGAVPRGTVQDGVPPPDLWARTAMLTAVVLGDALWRAEVPACFPEPAVSAPRRYAAAFLDVGRPAAGACEPNRPRRLPHAPRQENIHVR